MGASGFLAATLDFGEVERGFRALAKRVRVLTPAFRALQKPLRRDQREHAQRQEGPEGRWPPPSTRTLTRLRGRARGKKLRARAPRLLGRIPSALRVRSNAYAVWAISMPHYSGAHQDGARTGHGARLPARPFLWISDRLLGIARGALEQYVASAWKK